MKCDYASQAGKTHIQKKIKWKDLELISEALQDSSDQDGCGEDQLR